MLLPLLLFHYCSLLIVIAIDYIPLIIKMLLILFQIDMPYWLSDTFLLIDTPYSADFSSFYYIDIERLPYYASAFFAIAD